MRTAYEYIVVGCGGIGSAAAYWLSRTAGRDVLGLEQYRLGHDNGGSQDHSRILRLSYHAPEYTALTPATYASWAEVEAESGVQIMLKTGGLDIAPAGHHADTDVQAYANAMLAAGIPFEDLTAEEATYRWPQWRLLEGERVLYQADSGLVDPRKANATHSALARAHGATIVEQTPVRRIVPQADSVVVETDAGSFSARRLILTGGSWSEEILRGLGVRMPLTVLQEQVTYHATPNLRDFAPDRFPIWIFHGPDVFYGFPVYGEVATKAGLDCGGDPVEPDHRTFEPNPRAFQKLERFLERYVPGALGPVLYTKTCLYDMPPDRNFTIDTLPEHPQIAVAQGAAHAFKFACLIGRILSQLAIDGATPYPIDAFAVDRPALTDPAFPRTFAL